MRKWKKKNKMLTMTKMNRMNVRRLTRKNRYPSPCMNVAYIETAFICLSNFLTSVVMYYAFLIDRFDLALGHEFLPNAIVGSKKSICFPPETTPP